jgi:hypothetical protein
MIKWIMCGLTMAAVLREEGEDSESGLSSGTIFRSIINVFSCRHPRFYS